MFAVSTGSRGAEVEGDALSSPRIRNGVMTEHHPPAQDGRHRCFDVITANLYSELLEAILPRFRDWLAAEGRLILSGVMRTQESKLTRALRRNGFRVLEARRRGKWVALLASSVSSRAPARDPAHDRSGARSRSGAGGGSRRPKT